MSDFVACRQCLYVEDHQVSSCARCSYSGPFVPMQNTRGLTLEDMRRQGRSVADSAEQRAAQKKRWIMSFASCMQEFEKHPTVPEPVVALFWIKLYGILTELPDDFRSSEVFAPLTSAEIAALGPRARMVYEWHRVTRPALDRMRAKLSEDMCVYIEWRRHVECHFEQSSYRVQLKGKPGGDRSLKGASEAKLLGRNVEVEERWEAIRRLYAEHGDDHAVARATAQVVSDDAMTIVKAWRLLG